MNPLPPQAYTKDTLAKAFAWLQTQNDSIKELASTPDILVGLYLKTKIQGAGSLERPSIQNFKNELKSLAGMMGEFEAVETTPPPPPTAAAIATAPAPATAQTTTSLTSLDAKSLAMIQEVKGSLNLSTDNEALRALIALGYRGVKGLLG